MSTSHNSCYLCGISLNGTTPFKRFGAHGVCQKCYEDTNFFMRALRIGLVEVLPDEPPQAKPSNPNVYIDSDGSELKVNRDGGRIRHFNSKNQLHRLDGPACEYADGTEYWYQNGQLHRLDGPACEHANGDKYWYQNDQLHRLDGPAVECADGSKYWYQNGQYHRLDGPAVEHANGDKSWYQNDQRHRLDGPACEWVDGDKEWWIEGKRAEPTDPRLTCNKPTSTQATKDAVNHPSHYTMGKIEVIEAIEDWNLGPHEANVVKYTARAKHKGKELEDLKKARWYLDRKIQLLESNKV